MRPLLVFLILSALAINKSIAQKPIESLLVRINQICENEDIPGVMLSIVELDSVIYSGGIGYVNKENQELVTGKHLFRLGSISKSFTALGFVKLAEEGSLKLSYPIHRIDPRLEIKNKWQDKQPITVEQILEHTAGFDDMHSHANYPKKGVNMVSSMDMVEAHKKSLYARWKPGVRMAYSNPGYVLAGLLLERQTGKPYNKFLKQEILEPLKMNQSGFYFKEPQGLLMTTGYQKEGGKIMPIDFKSVQGGAASDFCSNADEMSRFLQFCLRRKLQSGDTLFDKKWFERIENPKTTIAAKKGFTGGYGLGNMSVWTNNYLFHGHDGGIDGYSSLYLYSREANFGLAVSMNVQGNVWVLVDEILDFYLGSNRYMIPNSTSISQEIKDKYSGFYNFKSPRNQTMYFIQKMRSGHTIEFDENTLLVKDFGGIIRDTLYHRGNNIFYRKNEGIPFVMLLENKEKNPVLWLGGEYADRENKHIRLITNYLIIAALLLSAQYFFVGFIWWLTQFFKKYKKSKKSRFILWTSSVLLIIVPVVFIATVELYERPESINLGSMTVFLGSIAFFISSLFSIVESFRLKNERKLFKWYYRITASSLLFIGFWLLSHHFIGFRLWAY